MSKFHLLDTLLPSVLEERMSVMRLLTVLCVLPLRSVWGYMFESNSSAYQRLDLHAKHSSFGSVVVVQRDVALVTAPFFSFNQFQDPDGILYVYRKDQGYWTLIRGITDLDYADEFGMSAAMHTDYFAVVGAPRAKKYGTSSGAAYYMYIESNPYKTQMETQQIVQSERHDTAGFGASVGVGVVNGQVVVAVGAPNHRGRGAVFTYNRLHDGTLGNEEILYTSANPTSDFGPESFGGGVSVGYNLVLGGAPGGKRGYVYVFQRGSGAATFSETAILSGMSGYTDDNDDYTYHPAENTKQVEEYGHSIAIGNEYIFVGAPHAYSQTDHGSSYGSVSIYKYTLDSDDVTGSVFTLSQTLTPYDLLDGGLNSFFGKSLSYDSSEKRLVVGSPYGEYPSTSLGFASVYQFDNYANDFELEALLSIDSYKPESNTGDMQGYGETERAGFGSSVSVYGGYVLVGAPQGAAHYGDAYFFSAVGVRGGESTSFYDLITGNIFTSLGLFLFPIAIIGLVMLMLLWKKYKDTGYDDSFSSFVSEEIGEFFGRVQSESIGAIDSCTSLQFMGEDDSAHSTHPMMVASSVPTKKKKKGKSSKFKSKTNVGNYESANFDDNL